MMIYLRGSVISILVLLLNLTDYVFGDGENDVCLGYITDYNICIQTAKRNWGDLDKPMNYCCFLIDIQDCRKLLKFKICEVESSSNSVTKAIHEDVKTSLSKILFIGDVCSKYKDSTQCFNSLGVVIVFLIFALFLTGIISFTMKKHRLLKDQLKNQLNTQDRPPNRLPNQFQFLNSVKRVRFL